MKGEIDRDFYCSADSFKNSICHHNPPQEFSCMQLVGSCKYYHRKWPTPAQYREEYGEEYPLHGAVYALWGGEEWRATSLFEATHPMRGKILIVCACTPWGRPEKDWRPG